MIQPPNNPDIEKVVLASMMQSDEEITEYGADTLTPEDFYHTDHHIIFKAMQEMTQSGVSPLDPVLVQDALVSTMGDEKAMTAVFSIIEAQTTSSIKPHCEKLREMRTKRDLLLMSYQMQNSIEKGEEAAEEIKLSVDNKLLEMEASSKVETIHVAEAIPETLEQIEGKSEKYQAMKFGYKDLDDITGGFRLGEVIVVGARPGMGKTAFECDVVLNNAEVGNRSLNFSMEMSNPQLISRFMTNKGKVSNTRIRHNKLIKTDFQKMQEAFEHIAQLPIHLNDNGELNAHQIRAETRRFKRKYPDLKFITIDYLQLMEETVGGDSGARLSINLTMRVLRTMAKELGIAVIILSQLNRKCEERKNPHKRPVLSDLKESGNIEQDAHIIIFLYRGSKYGEVIDDVPVKEEELEAIVAKVREGSPATAKLWFEGEYASITNMETQREEPQLFEANVDPFVMGIND